MAGKNLSERDTRNVRMQEEPEVNKSTGMLEMGDEFVWRWGYLYVNPGRLRRLWWKLIDWKPLRRKRVRRIAHMDFDTKTVTFE